VRLIGLTGGIASGKSTVSRILRELGAHVLDADELAREAAKPGSPALLELSRRFPFAIAPDGTLDRAKLGEWIFSRPEERAALEAILHPRIRELFLRRTEALAEAGVQEVVYDAPLLVENGLDRLMDAVLLVAVPREVQLSRLMERDGLTRAQAEARLASQLPLEEKVKRATVVIDNADDVDRTREQVERAWRSLTRRT
jgi:dephospho-CoA kinase